MVHKLQEKLEKESNIVEFYRLVIEVLLHDGSSLSSAGVIELSNQLDAHILTLMKIRELAGKLNSKTVDMDSVQSVRYINAY